MIVGLLRPTTGSIEAGGRDRSRPARTRAERRRRAREVQLVFNEPASNLDPGQHAAAAIDEMFRLITG